MPKFRKKPVEIEAARYIGGGEFEHMPDWLGGAIEGGLITPSIVEGAVFIETLEGGHIASPGDWIIRGVKGELYPCKPDIFAATYDEVCDA